VQQKNSLKVKNSVDKALKKLWKIQKEVEFQRHGEDSRTGHPPGKWLPGIPRPEQPGRDQTELTGRMRPTGPWS
jgi:hypothetical protein